MKLPKLLKHIPIVKQPNPQLLDLLNITGITDSSAEVHPGNLFIAVSGSRFDGHDFIQEAINKGASAVIGEQDLPQPSVPYIQVNNSKKVKGLLAGTFYHNPFKGKFIIGITGTNGKTTTSFLIKHILEESGISCSLIGTIHNIINGEHVETPNTTPDSITINKLLAESKDDAVVMEVSSHGLSQYRVEGIEFDLCLFTNLSQDHLDYHGTMENYFNTKKELFYKMKPNGTAIINTNDRWGRQLAEQLNENGKNIYTVGKSTSEDVQIIDYISAHGPSVTVKDARGTHSIEVPMAGQHNLYNAALGFAATTHLIADSRKLIKAISRFPTVPGRFEMHKHTNGATIVIDYAHTADAISHCLQTARELNAKRITHIFGFRGKRDPNKRAEMTKVSAKLSDRYLLTMDDLNNVSNEEMLKALENAHSEYGSTHGEIVSDRTLAIKQVIETSESGDWIIITGKGHEAYQQDYALGTNSDKETVLHVISNESSPKKSLSS